MLPHLLSHLSDFDNQLCCSLSRVVHHSLSDLTWQQATLPMWLGGLGIRQASDMVYAAYLGSCSDFKDLVLGIQRDSDFMLVGEAAAQQNMIGLLPSTFSFSPASQTDLQLHLDEHFYSEVLLQQSIRDRARLLALSDSSGLACAWLQVIPCLQIGLAIPPAEFVVALRLWLGIPVFSNTDSPLCVCGQMIDHFGDHLMGCGHGPLCIRQHNALSDLIYYTPLEDNSDVCKEQKVSGESAAKPGDIFHLDFCNGHPIYFNVSVRSTLHSGVLSHSAITPGFAALRGEMEKDAKHKALVEAAGGEFLPLVVDNFGIWTPSSVEILRSIARISTVWNGLSIGKAFHQLVERLSVQLYHCNAKMILHFWALHPHSEDDWLQGCSVEDEDLPQDVVRGDDCADMSEQSCIEVLSGLCRDNTVSDDNFPSAVPVTNRFSSLSQIQHRPTLQCSKLRM